MTAGCCRGCDGCGGCGGCGRGIGAAAAAAAGMNGRSGERLHGPAAPLRCLKEVEVELSPGMIRLRAPQSVRDIHLLHFALKHVQDGGPPQFEVLSDALNQRAAVAWKGEREKVRNVPRFNPEKKTRRWHNAKGTGCRAGSP